MFTRAGDFRPVAAVPRAEVLERLFRHPLLPRRFRVARPGDPGAPAHPPGAFRAAVGSVGLYKFIARQAILRGLELFEAALKEPSETGRLAALAKLCGKAAPKRREA